MPPMYDEGGDGEEFSLTPAPLPPAPEKSNAEIAVNTLFDYVEMFALTVFFILLLTLFFFRHAIVDGDSMNMTLTDGEHLIISDVFYTPAYGDIVVFESAAETGLDKPLVKRVIATEGQTVEIRESGVTVDGVALQEDYVYLNGSPVGRNNYIAYGMAYGIPVIREEDDIYFRYRVGAGEVFVMGDNRFNSHDGRMFGPISTDCILGRVLLRLTPFSKFGRVN